MRITRVVNKENRPKEETLQKKAHRWLGVEIAVLKIIDIYLIDLPLSSQDIHAVEEEILVDPILQKSFHSYEGTDVHKDFDWILQVGLKPGMKDGEGERTKGAITDLLGEHLQGNVYTAQEYLLKGKLSRSDLNQLATELFANDLINRISAVKTKEISKNEKALQEIPTISSTHRPDVQTYQLDELEEISTRRNLALSKQDIVSIKNYWQEEDVVTNREEVGLSSQITDVEVEAIAQTQSEHCKHKIFNGKITYENTEIESTETIDSLMNTYIKRSSKQIDRDWVLSSFWDNAGEIEFNEDYALTLKLETHNSPSAKDPYGGAITGIVGVYRDPLGTGKGSKIIAGSYGFVTPYPSYKGPLRPEIKPRRLLEGIVEGVRDGGNKSGVPTVTGYSKYDNSFLGKPLVYVGAVGLMPKEINGEKSYHKRAEPGDLIIIAGGSVGRDGIHGVTESSLEFSEDITSGHVQIGDPFTQKKVHDFILEARDQGLLKLVWDLGGGGLSSAIGETAQFSGGCILDLKKAPLKYEGLDPWEILVSESQERMLMGISPDHLDDLGKLARKHDVDIANLGEFTDSGYFHVKYGERTVAYLDLDFLHHGFPQYELEAIWRSPQLSEPDFPISQDLEAEFLDMLARPNIASKEWIQRQYDYEVQGNTVIKPLVGKKPVKSDGSVIKPLPDVDTGVALGLGNNFHYSKIDPYWMAASSLEEALRRVISVGADPNRIALNDNFTWPNTLYHEKENPEGKLNLGKLVRANKALFKFTQAFKTPCISGKDSMFITGNLPDRTGKVNKVSGIPALQFSALGIVNDVHNCRTLTPQREGDLIYLIGVTRNELGGSEFYEYHGKTGTNVPRVNADETIKAYDFIHSCIKEDLVLSVHGIYRGGLIISLAEMAIAADMGLEVNLGKVPLAKEMREDKILYSETPSRFLITVDPEKERALNERMTKLPAQKIGVIGGKKLVVKNLSNSTVINTELNEIKQKYYETFEGF